MSELLSSTSLFAVVLTLAAYELGCFCQRRTGLAVCNPILLGAVGVAAVLRWASPAKCTSRAAGLSPGC